MNETPPLTLCRLEELDDPGSRGFTVSDTEGRPCDIFLVRAGDVVRGYLNSCPHTGGPLDCVPDRFLDLQRSHLQCATHDARFRIGDGVCVAGPCAGDRLTPVPVALAEGRVVLLAPPPAEDSR